MNRRIVFIAAVLTILFCGKAFTQYENHDAVYLQLTKEYTLNADGSMDYRFSKQQKLQTYRSFHNLYGETFITYDPLYQSLKVNEAFVIMANGKKTASPPNAFNEVLPGFAANAPAYNRLREMVITHAGTERQAVIHLDYTLHTKKGYYPALMVNEMLAENEPVQKLTVRIRIPAGTKPVFSMVRTSLQPVITSEGAFTVYTWSLADVPAIFTEDFTVGGNERIPRLLFSTARTRSEILSGFLSQAGFSAKLPQEARKIADSLLSGASEEEKLNGILALQNMVVNDMRLYSIPMKYTGYQGRSPEATWNSNGGTALEKTILLTAMFREAGIPATPFVTVRTDFIRDDIGNLADIDDLGVMTELKETGLLWISASSRNPQNLSMALPGRTVLFFDTNGKLKTLPFESVKNRIKVVATLGLNDKNQLTGDLSMQFDKGVNPWLLLQKDKSKAKSYLGGGFSSGDLKEMKIANISQESSFLSYSVQKEKPFREDTNYRFFTLPALTNGIESWGIHYLPKDRLTALETPFIVDESYEVILTLPKEYRLFSEMKKEIRNSAGSFSFEMMKEGERIILRKSLKTENRIIDPAGYSDFKQLMDYWNNENYREVVFVK